MADELDHYRQLQTDNRTERHPLATEARAALATEADGPAVPEGREPAAVMGEPSDEEIMGLMPQQMHEDLAAAVRAMAEQEGIDSTPAKGVMRIILNRHIVDLARAVLSRYNHQPAPPAAGEVAELVAWLRTISKHFRLDQLGDEADRTDRAADLLAQRHPAPVPVSERLPEPNTKVLAHYFNDHGKGRTICAIWVPAGSRECTGDDSISEPAEGCWPEGWYEQIENWEDYGWIAVNEGEVAYWQPLPKWPATALPLPAGEVQS